MISTLCVTGPEDTEIMRSNHLCYQIIGNNEGHVIAHATFTAYWGEILVEISLPLYIWSTGHSMI